MIDMRPATDYDIRHVVFRMWQRGTTELAKIVPEFDREAVIKVLRSRSKEYGFTFFYHGEPVAVFGAHAISDHEYHTWFTATDGFERIGRNATRFLRKLVQDKTAERPGVRLELWSAVDHPQADRWFRSLGFIPLAPEGVFNRYLYAPQKR